MNCIFTEKRKPARYKTTAAVNNDVKTKFCMIRPPTVGPIILAIEGIIEEKTLRIPARTFDSLNLNWTRLKLGQKVVMLNQF